MTLWQKLKAALLRKRKEKEWANRFHQPPANPKHLTPLDPNDPWKT